MFSLGLCLLEAGNLCEIQDIFDLRKREIKYNVLDKHKKVFKDRYENCYLLEQVLDNMLHEDADVRYDFKVYRDIVLPKLQEVIMTYSEEPKDKKQGSQLFVSEDYQKKAELSKIDMTKHMNYSFNEHQDLGLSSNYESCKVVYQHKPLKKQNKPLIPPVIDFKSKAKPDINAIRINFMDVVDENTGNNK